MSSVTPNFPFSCFWWFNPNARERIFVDTPTDGRIELRAESGKKGISFFDTHSRKLNLEPIVSTLRDESELSDYLIEIRARRCSARYGFDLDAYTTGRQWFGDRALVCEAYSRAHSTAQLRNLEGLMEDSFLSYIAVAAYACATMKLAVRKQVERSAWVHPARSRVEEAMLWFAKLEPIVLPSISEPFVPNKYDEAAVLSGATLEYV